MQRWSNSSLKIVKHSFNQTTSWLKYLEKYGFFILADTVSDKTGEERGFYEELASRLNTKIYASMYGEIWDTAGERGVPSNDLSYTNISLPPHTDLNYVRDTPKYQIFTSVHTADVGGETVIVDGANVLQMFRDLHPKASRLLAAKSFVFTCSERKFTEKHCLFGGEDGIIRHNHGDMERTDLEEYQEWNALTLDPYFSVETKLLPGDTIVIDNHRVFHGRTSFQGYRNVRGCYLL